MPGNPNMQKLGKRKGAPAKPQPDWLFPGAGNSTNSAPSKNAQEKKPANNSQARAQAPPSELVSIVSSFLAENEFMHTSRSFATEKRDRGQTEARDKDIPSLSTIYNEWRQLKEEKSSAGAGPAKKQETPKAAKKDVSDSSSSDSDSSSDSSSEDSDVEMADADASKKRVRRKASPSASSSSSSDSDADDENETPVVKAASPKPKANALKRKEHPDTSSSSSDSDSSTDSSSDSSSEDEAPKAKKAKTAASSSSDDSSSDDSSSDSDSDSENETGKAKKADAESSSSGSDSSSDSDSDSDSSTHSAARKVPLPESDSDSTSDSDSDSDSDEAPNKVNSDTSATLSDRPKNTESSSDSSSNSSSDASEAGPKPAAARQLSPPLPPNPTKKLPRKNNVPFSRIPVDTKVDARLASNAYVPYDYAQRAHEDLIVTKGKGFTKEKNKKKRGSYRGGYIDIEGKKGIKFDD